LKQFQTELDSIRHEHEHALGELEGKYLWSSIVGHFFKMCFLSPVMIMAKE
jgi:hypothetical protein